MIVLKKPTFFKFIPFRPILQKPLISARLDNSSTERLDACKPSEQMPSFFAVGASVPKMKWLM